MNENVLIIPSYNPDERLLELVRTLHDLDFWRIVIVDDGSRSTELFDRLEEMKCQVVHHPRNLGKGQAIRTGLQTAIELYHPSACITLDCDGQHLPEDVLRLSRQALYDPQALILGVRDFSGKDVPFKSRLGNRVMSLLFELSQGKRCPDTQTGLRLIPSGLFSLALETPGDRYEYEMDFLSEAASRTTLRFVPIETVYENNNAGSHFRPVRDSWIVLRRFARFALSSLASTGLDYLLFALVWTFFPGPVLARTWAAVFAARTVSGLVNFLLNRYWSFQKGQKNAVLRYGIVWLCQMILSGLLISWLESVLPVLAAKILVDGALFLASYWLQKNWVFRQEVII